MHSCRSGVSPSSSSVKRPPNDTTLVGPFTPVTSRNADTLWAPRLVNWPPE